ncbi:hypothetical protein N0V88_007545 [Collariella sp. IMI 366227]|nr:hypothetical protein N0V88_007545 [Collariella sp. IMI 366227]
MATHAPTGPVSPGQILTLASSIRGDGSSPVFSFGTDHKPFNAGECRVYAVKFPDNVTWAVRVPVQAGEDLAPAALSCFVDAHAKILTKLTDAGFRWSPKLIHHDTGSDNAIGCPYLILSWIHGTALEWTDTVPSGELRAKVLHQVVDIQLELAECTKKLRHDASSSSFLTGMVDGQVRRTATGKVPEFRVRDCLIHRALVRHAVDKTLEFDPTIFAVSHENLAAHSIIVDADHNITGITDWTFARALPLQLAFRLPRFLAIEPENPRETASQVPHNIEAFTTQFLQPSASLIADRQVIRFYLSSLISNSEKLERASLAQTMKTVHSKPDASWRYLVIEACFSKGLHDWLAQRSWLLHGTKADLAAFINPSQEMIKEELDGLMKTTGTKEGLTHDSLWEEAIKH